MKFEVRAQGRSFQVEVDGEAPRYRILVDGRTLEVDAANLGDDALLTMLLDNASVLAHTRIADLRRGLYDVSIAGKYRRLEVLDALAAATEHGTGAAQSGRHVLEAPMPGLVVAVHVTSGARVAAGTPLVVIEAMKMQNELQSEVAGLVTEIKVRVGEAVESGTPLVVLDAG